MMNELARLGAATVYEANGRTGLIDVALHQVVAGSRVAGLARTVRCAQDDNLMVHLAMAELKPGEVLVIAMPEATPVALVGELLATQAQAHGAAGLLIDAAVRDLEELQKMGLPIWCRFVRVRGASRKTHGELNVAVTIGGAFIRNGDVVVMDADGAVVIAAERVDEVLQASLAREKREAENRNKFQSGVLSADLYGLRSTKG
jgi:4-hydroxy-4-methyl-2-oxoglutarate aldolase